MAFCGRGPKGDPGRVLNPGEAGQRGGSKVEMVGTEYMTAGLNDQLVNLCKDIRIKSLTIETRQLKNGERLSFFLAYQSWMIQMTVYTPICQNGLVMISLVDQQGAAIGSVVLKDRTNTGVLIVPTGIYRLAVRSNCCIPITLMFSILANL
jgi:hypothetical protein